MISAGIGVVERNPFIFFWQQRGERGEGKGSEEGVRGIQQTERI